MNDPAASRDRVPGAPASTGASIRPEPRSGGAAAAASTPDAGARRPRGVLVAALLVALAWLVIGAIGGPTVGKLSEVQKNDNANFLPASVESVQVTQEISRFSSAQSLPMVLVVEAQQALTQAQLGQLQQWAASLPQTTLQVGDRTEKLSHFLSSQQVAAAPSQDRKAAAVVLQINPQAIGDQAGSKPLDVIAKHFRDHPAVVTGAQATTYTAGPAAYLADLVNSFSGLDGMLLYVTLGVVLVILLLVYRSPFLPIVVLASAVLGLSLSALIVYPLAKHGTITLDGQSQGIMSILAVGAATDYALLIVSRFKEELHDTPNGWTALRRAWLGTIEPIAASGGTVILGLLCLRFAKLGNTSGLGPVGALGIAGALLAAITLLPALLLLFGRRLFWPVVPKVDHVHRSDALERGRGWGAVARAVGRRPRATWIVTLLVLLMAASFVTTLKANGIADSDTFRGTVPSVEGQQAMSRHFPLGTGSPVVVITPQDKAQAVVAKLTSEKDVVGAYAGTQPGATPKVVDGDVMVQATLGIAPDSPAAMDVVQRIRTDLHAIDPGIKVGGSTATNVDMRDLATRDNKVIMPTILGVVFVVLMLLLRSFVAPVMLVIANTISFGATLGIYSIVFNHIVHAKGSQPMIPLYGFVFLVALGIDYSIFLMTRAREETGRLGPRQGMLTALAVTGGVITSAGIVLASTFAALTVLPLLFLLQVAFIVAFGVLLDTLVVRSLLVPALGIDLGRWLWWPGHPERSRHAVAAAAAPGQPVDPTSGRVLRHADAAEAPEVADAPPPRRAREG